MLDPLGINKFNFSFTNYSSPSTTPGTSVIPGASNAEGDWTEIASSANISQDVNWVKLLVYGGAASASSKQQLLDLGWDLAGGTSYVQQIANVVCGNSNPASVLGVIAGVPIRFPIFIKSGSAVAVRVQGNNATAGTIRVMAEFLGQPSQPHLIRTGQYSETIGTITDSSGVSFTPGNSGAEGNWQSLGTTTRAMWHWQLGLQCNDTTMQNIAYCFDLAYGDVTNKTMIIQDYYCLATNSEALSFYPIADAHCDVPGGAELFVRGSCSGTSDAGWNAVAVGIGG